MFNLKDTLQIINEKYKGKDTILGKNLLTMANRLNSSRGIMVGNQFDQYVVLKNPDKPRMFTNYEDIVGKFSSAYFRAEHNLVIMDRIAKFEDKPDHLYTLVVYNKKLKMYDVIMKQHGEKLTENYGYLYNNEVLDSKSVGDEIEQGEVLYRSTSFDASMNYSYGVNAKTLYTIDPDTIEDAIKMSKSLQKRLVSVELEPVRISLNNNDVLINWYGNADIYKGFADICEEIKDKVLAVKRRIMYSNALFDFKYENMFKINYKTDDVSYVSSSKPGKVVDINIYYNIPYEDIPRTKYNEQLLKYIDNENRYHKEIVEKLGPLVNSGAKCSSDLDFLYKRSKDILDPTVKWKDSNNSNFNNMILEFLVEKESGVSVGSKLCGRYGDKGVVSQIVDDDEMPFAENGVRVEMVCNVLGIVNRLNPGQLYEVELNFLGDNIVSLISKASSITEKEHILFTFYSIVSPDQGIELRKFYDRIPTEGKLQFWEDIEREGLYIHQPPMNNNITMDKFAQVYSLFGIEPYTCYINRFGRTIKIMNKLVIGDKYILKLKHTPKGKFSARSTGYLNSKELPFKSSASKNNKSIFQKTPVRFGEMEYSNLLCNMDPDTLTELSQIYSTSIKARRNTSQLYEGDALNLDHIKIDEDATNRTAEILTVYMKTMGVGIEFEEVDDDESED